MASGFKLKSVTAAQLSDLMTKPAPRGRTSKGQELIEEFLASGEVAASVALPSDKERNAVSISAGNFVRRAGSKVWIRKTGPTELLLINLDKAPAEVKKAYDSRPRVGRQPAKKK
jgi:hypothetical protein